MVRRLGAVTVAVLMTLGVLTWSAPPASARPGPLDLLRPGAIGLALTVRTSGLPLTYTGFQQGFWNGQAVVAVVPRPTPMFCAGYAETQGSMAIESGGVILLCNGSTVLGPAYLNCELLVLRVGAVMELDGYCTFGTPNTAEKMLTAGVLAFAPLPPVSTVVTDYALTGSLAMAGQNIVGLSPAP